MIHSFPALCRIVLKSRESLKHPEELEIGENNDGLITPCQADIKSHFSCSRKSKYKRILNFHFFLLSPRDSEWTLVALQSTELLEILRNPNLQAVHECLHKPSNILHAQLIISNSFYPLLFVYISHSTPLSTRDPYSPYPSAHLYSHKHTPFLPVFPFERGIAFLTSGLQTSSDDNPSKFSQVPPPFHLLVTQAQPN